MTDTTAPVIGLDLWAVRVHAALEKWERVVVTLSILALIGLAAGYARYRPLWLDEYYTYYTAVQPSAGAIWNMQASGPLVLDPPLYHWLAHYSMRLFGSSNFGLRFPSVLAYGVACLCIYWLVRKRAGPLTGLIAIGLTIPTIVLRYAHEGRPYILMVTACAGALLAWSSMAEKSSGRKLAALGLFLSMAVAVSSHWYGCLVAIPVLCGEAVRTVIRRKLDWSVLAACGGGAAVALLYLPLVKAATAYQSKSWKGVRLLDVRDSYKFILDANPLMLALTFLVLASVAVYLVAGETKLTELERPRRIPLHESVALLACGLLPFFGYILARAVVHQFLPRYVIASVVAFVILIAFELRLASKGSIALLVVAFGATLVSFGASAIDLLQMIRGGDERTQYARSTAVLSRDTSLPIVVDEQNMFFRLSAKAPGEIRARTVHLTDPSADAILQQESTTSAALAIRRWTKLPVKDYAPFIAEHRQFLLISDIQGYFEWVGQKVQAEGATLRLEGLLAEHPVFLVTMPERQAENVLLIGR